MNIKTIHPFPARMAPEIALNSLKGLKKGSTVLDPMMGSGTTIKVSTLYGHQSLGFDMDPLAVLISKVWNTPLNLRDFASTSEQIVKKAKKMNDVSLSWIDENKAMADFINFWFAEPQKNDLRKLSKLLFDMEGDIADALRVALSRLIITKDKGASLGRDISHSRPHKVRKNNNFNIFENFQKSVNHISKSLKNQSFQYEVNVSIGDARNMKSIEANNIDFIITSPPYLHAVDYLRGHKLSLVWLGYKISNLRTIRGNTIGIEKKPENDSLNKLIPKLVSNIGSLENLEEKKQQFIHRYAIDLFLICKEFYRVLKPGGKATVVIADSYVSGELIQNAQTIKNAAEVTGLGLLEEKDRQILSSRRYLPPPSKSSDNNLAKRMKTEAIITFLKPN